MAALQRALQRIVERHPCLRTTFRSRGGEPVQLVRERGELEFRYDDATAWTEAELEARLAEDAYRPFDLEKGPLVRALLLRRPQGAHVVLLAIHHIAVDLWSWAIFLQEFGVVYAAESGGTIASLAPLRYQFTDHVRAEAEMLSGAEGERLWTYWRGALGDELPRLALPADRLRPPSPSFHGATRSVRFDAELTTGLRSLGAACGATPFMTLLAAFQVLLHRYSGQDAFLLGSVSACRSAGRARVMGYFANLVVLRSDLSGDPSFRTLLGRTRACVREAFDHARFPHALLVERLRATRGSVPSPLVQAVFAWQKTTPLIDAADLAPFSLGERGASLTLGGLPLERHPVKGQPAPFELTLLMADAGAELVATLEYQTDLFEGSSMSAMLHQFGTLLRGIVRDPDRPISSLPLLSDEERREIVAAARSATPDPASLVHEAVQAQAQRTPAAVAVALGQASLTYGELDRRSNQIAHHLRRLGVEREALVGVLLERSLDLVTALLGIWKAGGAYLPLDPALPDERLAFLLEDSRPRALLTRHGWQERLPAPGAELVLLDRDQEEIARASAEAPPASARPDDLAYVIYTSGSTGQPKGVLIPHSAIAVHCRDVIQLYELAPADRVLQFASSCFDASLEQILPTLMSGATLVLRGQDIAAGPAFQSFVSAEALTVVNVPPAYWSEWIRGCAERADAPRSARLRLVIVGGDAMPAEVVELWARSPLRNARLLNAYGPTETTITATTYEVPQQQEPLLLRARIPIGKPVGARALHVLDHHGHPAPVGVPGELHIGGAYVARGYLRRPELTAERFVPDPFGHPGTRLYRTGDLVRRLADGNIEFLGRRDGQVKIRGFRVELEEIETVLARHPAVREAAVLAQDLERGTGPDRRLVAYVSTAGAATAGELRAFLGARLPEYMVPATFVEVESFPRSAGGKVDRGALPLPDATRAGSRPVYAEPRGPVEAKIAAIWSEVLGVERVGRGDDFFELGGHSLLGTRIVSRLHDAFGVDLPLRHLFEAPTVEGLALAIVRQLAAQEEAEGLDDLLEEIERLPEGDARSELAEGERRFKGGS